MSVGPLRTYVCVCARVCGEQTAARSEEKTHTQRHTKQQQQQQQRTTTSTTGTAAQLYTCSLSAHTETRKHVHVSRAGRARKIA